MRGHPSRAWSPVRSPEPSAKLKESMITCRSVAGVSGVSDLSDVRSVRRRGYGCGTCPSLLLPMMWHLPLPQDQDPCTKCWPTNRIKHDVRVPGSAPRRRRKGGRVCTETKSCSMKSWPTKTKTMQNMPMIRELFSTIGSPT